MIVLRSPELIVRIDPGHGAEVLDLIDLRTGRQLLGRTPYAAALPKTGELDAETWLKSYRGGWQLMVPNAGLESTAADGVKHGFHGAAGIAVWEVKASNATSATLAWAGHGIEVTRSFTVRNDVLDVETTIAGTRDNANYIGLEHLALGMELLHPAVNINFDGGKAWEMPLEDASPKQGANWPDARLMDGGTRRIGRLSLDAPAGNVYCVGDLTTGKVTVLNDPRGDGIEMTWDTALFPYCWVWEETRFSDGIWRKHGEMLGIEPSTVPFRGGLGEAQKSGRAHTLNKGQTHRYVVSIKAIPEK